MSEPRFTAEDYEGLAKSAEMMGRTRSAEAFQQAAAQARQLATLRAMCDEAVEKFKRTPGYPGELDMLTIRVTALRRLLDALGTDIEVSK